MKLRSTFIKNQNEKAKILYIYKVIFYGLTWHSAVNLQGIMGYLRRWIRDVRQMPAALSQASRI